MNTEKINRTIEKIKKAEFLALQMNPAGFYVNFSGGKDSIVLLDLVRRANVKHIANMQLTTVDAPSVLKFVKENYQEVVLHKPKLSMFELIKKKKQLPLRKMRFCCAYLKESAGVGFVNLIGIRKSESIRRAKRNEVEVSNFKYSKSFDMFDIDKDLILKCVKGKDKLLLSPIFDWSNNEVWSYIRENNLKYPDLYNSGYKRIGCILCPMSSRKGLVRDILNFPKFVNAYKKAISHIVGKFGYMSEYTNNPDEIINWWISKQSAKVYFINKRIQTEIPYSVPNEKNIELINKK